MADVDGRDCGAKLATAESDNLEAGSFGERISWSGTLSNFRLGPMMALDDEGYLVPLWTPTDLLRGCRYFWRRLSE